MVDNQSGTCHDREMKQFGSEIPRLRGETQDTAEIQRVRKTIASGEARRSRSGTGWQIIKARYTSTCEKCHERIETLDQVLYKRGHIRHLRCDKQGTSETR